MKLPRNKHKPPRKESIKTPFAIAAALALLASSALTQAGGLYASVGLGQSSFNNLNKTALASDVLSVDRIQGSQFFVLGYKLTPNWAAELSYSYLGKFKMDRGVTNANEYSYNSAYSIAAVGRFYPFDSGKGRGCVETRDGTACKLSC